MDYETTVTEMGDNDMLNAAIAAENGHEVFNDTVIDIMFHMGCSASDWSALDVIDACTEMRIVASTMSSDLRTAADTLDV